MPIYTAYNEDERQYDSQHPFSYHIIAQTCENYRPSQRDTEPVLYLRLLSSCRRSFVSYTWIQTQDLENGSTEGDF